MAFASMRSPPAPLRRRSSGAARPARTRLSAEENQRKLDKLEHNLAQATPLPRTGHPEDIAHAALLLASDEGSFINCHDLVVDGGRVWQFHERH